MPIITIHRPDAAPLVVEVDLGTSLFDAGAKVGAGIETACVGKGTCGLCRVRILAGQQYLNAYTAEEEKHLGNVYYMTKVRLACRAKPSGDVAFEVVRPKRRLASKSR